MLQRCSGMRFGGESTDRVGTSLGGQHVELIVAHDFEGDDAVGRNLSRAINDSHSPPPQFRENFEARDLRINRRRLSAYRAGICR